MDMLLKQMKTNNVKIVFLDEAVFTFNTFSTRAWSASYSNISVKEARIKIKT